MQQLIFSDGKSVKGCIQEMKRDFYTRDVVFTAPLRDGSFMYSFPTHIVAGEKFEIIQTKLYKQESVGEQGDAALTLHCIVVPAE